MSDGAESFGRRAAGAESASELLKLEQREGMGERFESLDALAGDFVVRSVRGEQPIAATEHENLHGRGRKATLQWNGASAETRSFLDSAFSVEGQQSRGAWSLPDEATLKTGLIRSIPLMRADDMFANNAIFEDRCKVEFASSPEAVLVWSVAEPFFEDIFTPFRLRGEQEGKNSKPREKQIEEWRSIREQFEALGIDASEQLLYMGYGGGWSRIRAEEKRAAKRALAETIYEQVDAATWKRYRALQTLTILQRYYARSNSEGQALRKRVLTRNLERRLSGIFAGDWLSLLDYLGEAPHPEEQITTALPESKLYLGKTQKAQELASKHGLSEEQINLMLASLYDEGDGSSPVETRIEVLKDYWLSFDEAHARQESGMVPLWGLAGESRRFILWREGPYHPALYEHFLSRNLIERIENCWSGAMFARWPERIATEISPHVLMSETFGPALKFWQGCALTAWFMCEGPYSRTTMSGLEHYHRRELAQMRAANAPVDSEMFKELTEVESRLEARKSDAGLDEAPETLNTRGYSPGLYSRLPVTGFKELRDIVTRYRRAWTEKHLERYLRSVSEDAVKSAAREYYRSMNSRGGKPLTVKQFAKVVHEPVNHWFGGDLGAIYRAFGETVPVRPTRVQVLPEDKERFVTSVYANLGGSRHVVQEYWWGQMQELQVQDQDRSELANLSLNYLQLEEVLDCSPTLKEFGASRFKKFSENILSKDVDLAWDRYEEIVQETLRAPRVVELPKAPTPSSGDRVLPTTDSRSQATTNRRLSDSPLSTQSGEPEDPAPKRSWWKSLLGR
jgi:hypothetical protein